MRMHEKYQFRNAGLLGCIMQTCQVPHDRSFSSGKRSNTEHEGSLLQGLFWKRKGLRSGICVIAALSRWIARPGPNVEHHLIAKSDALCCSIARGSANQSPRGSDQLCAYHLVATSSN